MSGSRSNLSQHLPTEHLLWATHVRGTVREAGEAPTAGPTLPCPAWWADLCLAPRDGGLEGTGEALLLHQP